MTILNIDSVKLGFTGDAENLASQLTGNGYEIIFHDDATQIFQKDDHSLTVSTHSYSWGESRTLISIKGIGQKTDGPQSTLSDDVVRLYQVLTQIVNIIQPQDVNI